MGGLKFKLKMTKINKIIAFLQFYVYLLLIMFSAGVAILLIASPILLAAAHNDNSYLLLFFIHLAVFIRPIFGEYQKHNLKD